MFQSSVCQPLVSRTSNCNTSLTTAIPFQSGILQRQFDISRRGCLWPISKKNVKVTTTTRCWWRCVVWSTGAVRRRVALRVRRCRWPISGTICRNSPAAPSAFFFLLRLQASEASRRTCPFCRCFTYPILPSRPRNEHIHEPFPAEGSSPCLQQQRPASGSCCVTESR